MNIEIKTRIERVRKVTTEQAEKACRKVTILEQMYGIKITRQALSYRVKSSKDYNRQQEARNSFI